MMTGGEMVFQMDRRSAAIMRNENAIVGLAPQKNIRIKNSQWEVVKIADSNDINGINSAGVVAEDVTPERAAYVFIEYIKEWHRSGRLRTLLGLKAFSQLCHARGRRSVCLEVFNHLVVLSDERNDFALVLQVISDGAVDLRKCERRIKVDDNCLRRVALIISRGDIDQTETVTLESDFACDVMIENFGQGTHL